MRNITNTCQECLMFSTAISTVISFIVTIVMPKIETDPAIAAIVIQAVLNFFIWRILVKRKYGSDTFNEDDV